MLNLLVRDGASVNIAERRSQRTPLMIAIVERNQACARFMITRVRGLL